jgi:K+-sensing histidine kinase KdpD
VRPAAFKRCLGNLMSNAARFAPSIAITGHRDHRWLTITVDDDGPGIPPDMREGRLLAEAQRRRVGRGSNRLRDDPSLPLALSRGE